MGRGDRLRDEIAARGFAHATVTGTSMLPTLRAGEIVRLERVDEVRPGQILAFEHGGGLLVHRVLRLAADHIVCRGDNRTLDDGRTPRAALVGRAVEVFGPGRGGGTRLKDDAATLRRADLRLAARRAGACCRHIAAEVALVARQASGGTDVRPTTRADLAGLFGPHPSASASSARPAVSAATYSQLPAAERVALVRGLLDDQTAVSGLTVEALAFGREQRLARASGCVRRLLRRARVAAGEPGDTTWPTADGTAFVAVHLFRAGELATELEAAGARVVELRAGDHEGTPSWCATVAPPGSVPRAERPRATR